jgi:homoserine kinase
VRERATGRDEIYGVTLSGAGPSVLVWCERGAEAGVAETLAGLEGARATVVAVAVEGASLS